MERYKIPYFSRNCSIQRTITNPFDIANNCNTSRAETTKKSIKYSYDSFSDNLSNEKGSRIFLQSPDKKETANITSSLESNKASGPNSRHSRILFLRRNYFSKQLTDLFYLSFMTDVFPSVLKTAKVVPFFKKDSKLD